MVKKYSRNKSVRISGGKKEIDAAEKMLDSISDIDKEIPQFYPAREGEARLQIQEAMEKFSVKASILVNGNTVYPYSVIIKEYRRLKKSGKLERMTNRFYDFLMNFDIAHYSKNGYIDYYGNDFGEMYGQVLAHADTPRWHTDVQRILDTIWAEYKGVTDEMAS